MIYYYNSNLEILSVESRLNNLPVVRPFLSLKAQQTVAFNLPHQWWRLVLLEELRFQNEYLSNDRRIGNRETRRRPKPHKEH